VFDIVSIGGAVQDLFFISPNFEVRDDKLTFTWGEKFVVDDLFVDVGGGACNSAVGFSRLGLKTALWARVADDPAGDFVLRRLREEKIAPDLVELVEGGRTSLSVIFVDETGERSIIMYRNGNDELDPEKINLEKVFDTRWLFVAELTGKPTPLVEQISEEAQKKNVKLAFVPGLEQLEQGIKPLREILPRTEVLIFNDYEAGKLLGCGEKSRYSEEEIKEMLKELCGLGAKIAVITKDVDGVQCYDGGMFYSHTAPAVEEIVDTTGAGDAFAAGFVAALVKGQAIDEALELGTRNAGSVIQKFGAQTRLLKMSNLKTQMSNPNVKTINV
jgi:ribokinase